MKDNFVNRPLSKKLNRQNIVSRIENLEGKTAIKPSSAMLVEDLSEITDEVNAAIIRAIDVNAGVVRMIMSGEDIYDGDVYNIHANLAGFNDAGEPTVWIDAQDGILRAGGGNVGMDEDGLWIIGSLTPSSPNKFIFYESDGTTEIASIYPTQSPDSPTIYDLKISVANPGGNLILDSGIALTNIEKIVIGTDEDYATWGSNSETGPAIFTQKTYSAGGTNEHGIVVADEFTNAGYAYAAFDTQSYITGSGDYDHMAGFQARTKHAGTGTLSSWMGFISNPRLTGGGDITTLTHFKNNDANVTSGTVTTEYGLRLLDMVGSTVYPIDVHVTKNALVSLGNIYNESTGANAAGTFTVGQSSTQRIGLWYINSGNSPADTGLLYIGSDVASLNIRTYASNAPIIFEVNSSEVARFTAHNFSLISGFFNQTNAGALTISGGEITATGPWHTVDTEGGATSDDIDKINGGVAGDILTLSTVSSSRDVTIKHNTGNILCGADFTLSSVYDIIRLMRLNSNWWICLSKQDNY